MANDELVRKQPVAGPATEYNQNATEYAIKAKTLTSKDFPRGSEERSKRRVEESRTPKPFRYR